MFRHEHVAEFTQYTKAQLHTFFADCDSQDTMASSVKNRLAMGLKTSHLHTYA